MIEYSGPLNEGEYSVMSEYSSGGPAPASNDVEAVKQLSAAREKLVAELRKSIVGMEGVIDEVLVSIFSRGHALLEGVPGLAKTLLVSSIAKCLSLTFKRIQFTPDLMPSDITGTELLQDDPETGKRHFMFSKGPIFANMVLADEINRTPPKTQAALLEAMQERQVTIGGQRHELPEPFFVLATQNPIEQEGTYPLPEAQQDRFLFKIYIKYPKRSEERDIIRMTTEESTNDVEAVFTLEEIQEIQTVVRRVPVSDAVIDYAMNLVRQTRVLDTQDSASGDENENGNGAGEVPEFVREYVAWGAGPRACQCLITGGKAKALLAGRTHVSIADIQAVAHPVLRHRILTNFHAEARGYNVDKIIDRLIEETPTDESPTLEDGQVRKILRP